MAKTRVYLTSQQTKTLKCKQLKLLKRMEELTRDGKLSILTKQSQFQLKD
jgi:hypothetical protein